MEILTKDKYEYADIRMTEEDPHLWIKTPQGIVNVFIGRSGRLSVTLWSHHDKKVTKRTSRGAMQVTNIEVDN